MGTLLCSSTGQAQTLVAYNTVAFGNGGRGINNPTVTVCAHVQPPANPCTGTLVTLYSNSALSAQTNPFLGDTFGNVNFWAAPGTYDISIAAPLLPTYTYSVTLGGMGVLTAVPVIAEVNLTTQAGNLGPTTFYAVPSIGAGIYRFHCYIVETQAATSSSTTPLCNAVFTDLDTSVAETISTGSGSGANTVGTLNNAFPTYLNVKASTNIQYSTSSYASSGATPMQYALHIRLEYLGP